MSLSIRSNSKSFVLSGENSKAEDLRRSTVKPTPDFSITDRPSDHPAQKYALLAIQAILFPWGLYEAGKYCLQRLIMIPLYPAQSGYLKRRIHHLNPNVLNAIRAEFGGIAKTSEVFLREITFERNGVRYDGLMLGKKNAIGNGNWILQATGNAQPIEFALECAEKYSQAGFNTLLINGPSVGRSEGHATPQSMGEAQETGLQFLETTIKAKQIAIAGFSLGGAMVGQAILQHKFRKDVKYLAIRQVTFDRTTNIVKKTVPILKILAKHLILWTGLEMDNIEASRKLQSLGIREVIIQASKKTLDRTSIPKKEDFETDGVIQARSSLGYRLVKDGITQNKIFRCIEGLYHNDGSAIFDVTRDELKNHLSAH